MIGLGLLWDIADAAAYFCSQRRARLQRLAVVPPTNLVARCAEQHQPRLMATTDTCREHDVVDCPVCEETKR